MALVRTSAAAAAARRAAEDPRTQTRWAPEGAARENIFGTINDADDAQTDSFLFTQKPDVLDGYIEPAARLALAQGLDCAWDEWTRAALRSALATRDLLSKRMLWLAFLAHLPQVAEWFVLKGPPGARAWVEHVRTELDVFCLGQTNAPPGGDDDDDKDGRGKKRGARRPAKRARADEPHAAPPQQARAIYPSVADFVASMTAYYLAL
jgi:hypothetical protein